MYILIGLMPPTQPIVFLVADDALLRLVPGQTHGPTKLLCHFRSIASLEEEGVDGLHSSPALVRSHLGQVRGTPDTPTVYEFNLNPMDTNLYNKMNSQ